MIKNKLWFAEQVLLELQPNLRNRDEKIDAREICLRLDAVTNQLAKEGFLENWKFGIFGVDELYKTRFEWLTVTDPSPTGRSFCAFPTNWVDLPKQSGIDQVYFQNDPTKVTKKYFDTVIITTFKDQSTYRNNMANGMQGRISAYPQGGNLVFDRPKINATYGNIGMSLLIRDSSKLSDSDMYPIPANMEQTLIDTCVNWFRTRMNGPLTDVRDDNPKT